VLFVSILRGSAELHVRHENKTQKKATEKFAEAGGGGLESYRQATKLLSKCVKTNEAERTNKAR